jgi:hypothetical protein
MAEFERQVWVMLREEDLANLHALATRGMFASRDPEWIKDRSELQAVSVLNYIDKFEKRVPGFREHYNRLSERCHPNSLGHNFMFSQLDRATGTVHFFDERFPVENRHSILAALGTLPIVESLMTSLDNLIEQVATLQHRVNPAGGAEQIGSG